MKPVENPEQLPAIFTTSKAKLASKINATQLAHRIETAAQQPGQVARDLFLGFR